MKNDQRMASHMHNLCCSTLEFWHRRGNFLQEMCRILPRFELCCSLHAKPRDFSGCVCYTKKSWVIFHLHYWKPFAVNGATMIYNVPLDREEQGHTLPFCMRFCGHCAVQMQHEFTHRLDKTCAFYFLMATKQCAPFISLTMATKLSEWWLKNKSEFCGRYEDGFVLQGTTTQWINWQS